MLPGLPGFKIRLHVGSQDGIDSRLITLLLAEPFEKVGVQSDCDGLLYLGQYDAGVLPEIRVGRAHVGICLDRAADLTITQRTNPLPIALSFTGRFSSTLPFHIYIMYLRIEKGKIGECGNTY